MAKGNTPVDPVRRVQELKGSAGIAREYCIIVDMWLGSGEKYTTFCRGVVESHNESDGLYARTLASIKDGGARQLFEYFANMGVQMTAASVGDDDGGDAVNLPAGITQYLGKVQSTVSGQLSGIADLRQELEAARAEITRLQPFESGYKSLTGELDGVDMSPLEKLINEHS